MFGETVAAVSSPRGKGGVALLRISGEDAIKIAQKVFVPMSGKSLSECPARTAIYGKILAPEKNGDWEEVDSGLATVFHAPASFTGEDTVELCCHGGIVLTETVLSAIFAAGAKPAGAGEFTKRAFLNGKMGLSATEALGELLEAQTREQLLLAHNGLGGKTDEKGNEIYEKLKKVLASVYACIDYPEEDLADMSRGEMIEAFDLIGKDLQKLTDSYRTGHAVAEGIQTVICGKPNVGKSSLYNRIVGTEAAIVTDMEGTTRDILTQTATLGRVTLRLADTAGMHRTEDKVEKIGIERAEDAIRQAELILAVFDASRPLEKEDFELAEKVAQTNVCVVAIWNKCDVNGGEIPEKLSSIFNYWVKLSAQNGDGMENLQATVEQLFTDGALDVRKDPILTNARQYAAALSALEAVKTASDALRAGLPAELCCSDAERAMSAISELDGRAVSEDLVSEIFSHFCVGK